VKFHFEDQPHQAAAVRSVVDLFEGALTVPAAAGARIAGADGHAAYLLDREVLAARLAEVTERENVPAQDTLEVLAVDDLQNESRDFPNFSVEMETGTGKTFVYIETALRLAQAHELRKFVVLVHSVAIRAGVVKTLQQTRDFFAAKYPGLRYEWGTLGEPQALEEFLEPSADVRLLIAGVQSIDKPDTGLVYQEPDQVTLFGESASGMSRLAEKRPVVIVDEPQNMATQLRRQAIATLNPLVALRYSATHREPFNLVHRLGPKQASDAGLVKRVSVKGVVAGSSGVPYLRLDRLRSQARRLLAEVRMDVRTATGTARREERLRNGDDLVEVSGGLDRYRGLVVDRFERKPDRIVFENGRELRIGEEMGVDRLGIWSDQIRHTIRAHLDRERRIAATGAEVKVLSLFFVERVADYHGEGAPLPGMFDRLFREEWERSGRPPGDCPDPATLRVHYFPSTRTGLYRDAVGDSAGASEMQARAYEEIVANKELILARENPRAFIFSHSALKEGWDNPNVFQIGFLRHSGSEIERRQQIGRGLRLPVDADGRRVADPAIARLTLTVDESFPEFRDGLNAEYLAVGVARGEAPEVDDVDRTVTVQRRRARFVSEEFRDLWRNIRFTAHYQVRLETAGLAEAVADSELLDEVGDIAGRANVVQSADLEYDEAGLVTTGDTEFSESAGTRLSIAGQRLPDPVRLVEDQLLASRFPLQLTRRTVAAVVAALPERVRRKAIEDPERWARVVGAAIRRVAVDRMVGATTYVPEPEEEWRQAETVFVEREEIQPPLDPDAEHGVVPAPAGGANLFDHVVYDSGVERRFATRLEADRDRVRVFAKLPRGRYAIPTPVGEYSPDWAIVYAEGSSTRYVIQETKATLDLDDLEWDEAMRIRFGARYFAAAPLGHVDFMHTTDLHGVRLERLPGDD